MKRIKVIIGIAVVAVSLQPALAQQSSGSGGRDAQGSGAPPMTGQEPTQFEQFANKLKLDGKSQMPQVQSIFTSGAADASPIERDMMRLRTKMLESADKPEDLTAATTAYQADAVKMANVEIKTFGEIKAILKPNQVEKSAEAFVIMAGIFHPPTPRSGGMGRRGGGGVSQVRYESSGFSAPVPQRGGGGMRGGGGGMMAGPPTRFVALSSALPIAEDNRKHLKEAMDVEFKAAAPVRDQLTKTRLALSQAVASGGATDQAVADYAAAVAAMATTEMKALAKIIGSLPGEKPSGRGLDTAIYLMRGAFAGKKWDAVPDLKFY